LKSGGEIRLNKQITQVIPSESYIIDSEGCSYHYDQLIWAADLKTLYRVLNPIGLEADLVESIDSTSDQSLSSKGAESVFMSYIAVNRPPSFFQQNGGGHLFFTPSRQGLGETNRAERDNLIRNFDQLTKEEILAWLDKFIDLNTYEISIPVLRDPALAPEGQTGVMVSCLFDYQIFKKVEEAGWYEAFKNGIESRICHLLSETIYKGFEKEILFKFSSSPLTISKLSGSSEGAITGWSFEQTPPVVNKLQEIPKSVQTPISNVYQAGQWAYSPAGVPIAMLTGWYASQEIIKRYKKKKPAGVRKP
jgi:phytoene dehydrogenase-like protein